MTKLGTCRLCGIYGKLSFEHVPPRSAFNDRPVRTVRGRQIIMSRNLDSIQGKTQQRGAGDHTLCVRCNNLTGHWYGSAFVHWAYQGMDILASSRYEESLLYCPFRIFPLRVIKQILCMFFSANGDGFRCTHQDLVRLVLNREAKYLDPRIRIYAYFNIGDRARQTGIAHTLNYTGTWKRQTLSEIAFPPVGYVMMFDSKPPNERLVDISFFAQYAYNDWKELWIRLPVLSVYTYFPGDYRDRDEVQKTIIENSQRGRDLTASG